MRLVPYALAAICVMAASVSYAQGPKAKKPDPKQKGRIVLVNLDELPVGIAKIVEKHALHKKGKKHKWHNGEKKPKGKDKRKEKGRPHGREIAGKGPDEIRLPKVSLIEAIRIAEKVGRGTAFKAHFHATGKDRKFDIELVDTGGRKTKVHLDERGEVIEVRGPEVHRGGPPAHEEKVRPVKKRKN